MTPLDPTRFILDVLLGRKTRRSTPQWLSK